MPKIKKIGLGYFGSSQEVLIKKNNNYVAGCVFDNFFSGNKTTELLKTQMDPLNFLVNRHTILWKKNNKKIEKKVNNYVFSNFLFFFKKITFKGKGFKLKKTKTKRFKFYFGHSHPIYFFNYNLIGRKLTKYKHIFFSSKFKKLKKILVNWSKIKPISWYTKRGLKFSRQVIQLRSGKKAQQ